jgi:RHS repeat-associated protein
LAEIQSSSQTAVQSLSYAFDLKENVSLRVDNLSGLTESYDYDELNRLEHWVVSAPSTVGATVRYDYDDIGNMTGRTFEAGSGTNTSYETTQERGAGPYAVTSASGSDYSYDPAGEGNQTQAGSRSASFSAFGLPLSFNQWAQSYTFLYNANGERADKQVTGDWTTDDVVSFGKLYRRHSANGSQDHAYTVFGPTGPIAYVTADSTGQFLETYQILQDHLGSTETIVSSGGQVEKRKFDPFGNLFDPLNPGGPAPSIGSPVPSGFTGHLHDWDLGLINMKGRVYDPMTARFLSPDPVGIDPTTALGLNSYAYASNNPTTFNDPTGFCDNDVSGNCPTLSDGAVDSGGGVVFSGSRSSAVGGSAAKAFSTVDPGKMRTLADGTTVLGTWDQLADRYNAGKIELHACGGLAAPAGYACSFAYVALDDGGRRFEVVDRAGASWEGSNEALNRLGTAIARRFPGRTMNPRTKAAVDLGLTLLDAAAGLGKVAVRELLAAERQVVRDVEERFYRRGTDWESKTRLGKQAEAAERTAIGVNKVTGLHGVSVSRTVPAPGIEAVSATRKEIEDAGFSLVHTGTANDPLHHTLVLPKPIEKPVELIFNLLFGRVK